MKLAIDPGHGFASRRQGVYDPGAVGAGVPEASVVLQFGLTLRWACKVRGIDVWMTRDDQTDPAPLRRRDDRAAEAGCTHFVSLHCNSASDARVHGIETFYRDNADKAFAEIVQGIAVATIERPSRNPGVRPESMTAAGRLAVLSFPGPACLIELGFISNKADREAMLDINRQRAFCGRLADRLKKMR